MLDEFKHIKSIGFDLDGTLYESTPEIDLRVRIQIAKTILDKIPSLKTVEQAREFFDRRYSELESGTQVLEEAGYRNASRVMEQCLTNADILDLIPENKELSEIMRELRSKYETYLLTSSPQDLTLKKLERIGISRYAFSFSLYGENFTSKSNGEGFEFALRLSRFPGHLHVYIGDRVKQDILPAKSKKMKTIAVWSKIPEADFFIPTINNIEDILL